MADLHKEFPSKFISRDTLPAGGLMATIVGAEFEVGSFGRQLVLLLDNGQKFSLNATNRKALARKLGHETDNWISKQIQFALGPVTTPSGNTISGVVVEVPTNKFDDEPFVDDRL